jgi:hypothetical protein
VEKKMSQTQTPTIASGVQGRIRADAGFCFLTFGFVVSNEVYVRGAVGGACLIDCQHLSGNVYQLVAKQGFGDYFYPYVNGNPGVGECTVPVGRAANGAMVVTGGMNGCALQVNRVGNNFVFYHDNNGNSLAQMMPAAQGQVACRVTFNDYAGGNLADNLVDKLSDQHRGTTPKTRFGYDFFLITVKAGTKWEVYSSALLRKGVETTSWWSGDGVEVTFKPFLASQQPLASFNDF